MAESYRDNPGGALQLLRDEGVAADWNASDVRWMPDSGFDKGWLLINGATGTAYMAYPSKGDFEETDYERAEKFITAYESEQGSTKGRFGFNKKKPTSVPKGTFEAKRSTRLSTEQDVRRFIRESLQKQVKNTVERSALKEHFIGGMASIPAIGGGVMGMSLTNEAVGEDGDWELVDGDNFGHLEVGATYAINGGSPSRFIGWVDEAGQDTEADDPSMVQLRFEDVADGDSWEAYWHGDTYVWGSSADPLLVKVDDNLDEADNAVRLAKDDPHAGIDPNAVTPTQAKQFADVLADYVEDHLDEIAAFFVMKHDDDGLYPERIEDVPGMAASIAEKVAASFDVKALVERLVKYTFNKALYGE